MVGMSGVSSRVMISSPTNVGSSMEQSIRDRRLMNDYPMNETGIIINKFHSLIQS